MKMNLFTELICNVLLYSIGFGGLMVVCAVAEGQLSLLPALAPARYARWACRLNFVGALW